ncbi:hypothetical protein [Sinorhizobium chiapasense]|uniref:Transmembrane protein n=1 Tax=Sinorhizobium chiapasense TaxID=501572 RepID=A0ABZ2BDY2_9HYPH
MERLRAMPIATLWLAAIMAAGSVLAAPPDRRCTCRNRDGSTYAVGQTACIRVGDVSYLARCEMDLNVTTWRKVRDGCPTAQIGTAEVPLD